jgi:hypothetical protein
LNKNWDDKTKRLRKVALENTWENRALEVEISLIK